MKCPGCGNEHEKPLAVIDGLKKYACACGTYFSTREIVVMQGISKVPAGRPAKPGHITRYPSTNSPKEIAAAIARIRNENKKD